MNSHVYHTNQVTIHHEDVSNLYEVWPTPDVIISDGGYGVSGFKGDSHTPTDLSGWYKPHVQAWTKYSKPGTTLWFWNTEIGWAEVHPLLVNSGWEYVCCNIWDKGLQHIAGNCNLAKLKHFPIVTEICVQYVKRPEFIVEDKVLSLKEWIRYEWDRTGLPLYKANEACGVVNAASRKYLTKDHLWYAPPPEHFERLADYANRHGNETERPFFYIDKLTPLTTFHYASLFAKFEGQYGVTNVWNHPPLHTNERVRLNGSNKYAHLNQKPVELIKMLIETSTTTNDVIWEPFGGLCTGGYVAALTDRQAFCAEINETIYQYAVERMKSRFENWLPPQVIIDGEEKVIQYALIS